MTNISAEYGSMQAIAKNISNLANDYISNINEVYKIISDLENNWKGVDNVAYVNKANDYKEDLMALGEALNNYGIFLDGAAVTTNRTQEDIAASARR